MKRKCSIILVMFIAMLSVAKAGTIILEGTVGKYPIVMELQNEDRSFLGSYFYKKFKQDISLSGDAVGNVIKLSSDDTGDKFELTVDKSKTLFSGTYINGKGIKLPVQLRKMDKGMVGNPGGLTFQKELSDYSKIKLSDIKFNPGKTEAINKKYTIQWFTEPISKISMFKLVDGYSPAVMQMINRSIDEDFYQYLDSYFSCSGGEGKSGYDILEVSSYFLNDQFVSYCINSSWYCNRAAHPDFGEVGTTINAKTGKKMELEDIIWFGKGVKPKRDSDEWYKYRSEVFAPKIVELFKKLYPNEMKKPTTEDDYCDYTDPEVWDFGSWYLTDKGLYLGAYFYRAARSCDNPDWSVVPYSVLRKYNPALFVK